MPETTTRHSEKARFFAPGTHLRVVMEGQKEVYGEGGIKQAVAGTGHTIEFESDGAGGQFYETSDPEEIAFLRERSARYNVFSEIPIPKPASGPVLSQIVGLTARGDTDALVALAAEEEETHQRQDVLDAIADALENLRA